MTKDGKKKSKKLEVRKKDMDSKLEKEIISIGKTANKQCKSDKEIAEYIKTELDEKFGGPWNVIVGKKFGGVITYIPGHFIYFGISGLFILAYNTRNMKGPHRK